MKKIFYIIILLAVIIGGFLLYKAGGPDAAAEIDKILSEDDISSLTNFSVQGTVVMNNPGLGEDVPYIVYEEPGRPALTKKLVFDDLSVCIFERVLVPCSSINDGAGEPFLEARIAVEGSLLGIDSVLVRKMQDLQGENQPLLAKGRRFISWTNAVTLIENCLVDQVSQSHSLDVNLKLKNDQKVVAVEPTIDEVFSVVERSECPDIILATE